MVIEERYDRGGIFVCAGECSDEKREEEVPRHFIPMFLAATSIE